MQYFTLQQNKYMKTTNQEGGMVDPDEGVTIMQIALDATSAFNCFQWCRRGEATEENAPYQVTH